MSNVPRMLIGLAVLVCMTVDAQAQDPASVGLQALQKQVETLNTDIVELDFLSQQIRKAEKAEQPQGTRDAN